MRAVVVGAVVVVALVFAVAAGAIVNGEADNGDHPAVGALLAPEEYPDGTWAACSGTLISPTVFLTAAHCYVGAEPSVTFDNAYEEGDTTYQGTWYGNPEYGRPGSDWHDIAVVVLDEDPGIEPAQLPTAGLLDDLARGTKFTSVGYGATAVTVGPGGPSLTYDDIRNKAVGTLNAVNKTLLRISQNAARGNGGTCYADSGGPNFLWDGQGETVTVAATTSSGDRLCRATNVVYRLDTESARTFLGQYVTLP
jgi:secreted trypsin-like serine protease